MLVHLGSVCFCHLSKLSSSSLMFYSLIYSTCFRSGKGKQGRAAGGGAGGIDIPDPQIVLHNLASSGWKWFESNILSNPCKYRFSVCDYWKTTLFDLVYGCQTTLKGTWLIIHPHFPYQSHLCGDINTKIWHLIVFLNFFFTILPCQLRPRSQVWGCCMLQ